MSGTNTDCMAKPTLLIIELDYHAEVLSAICPILATRFSLIIWTTNKIWQKAGLASSLFEKTLIMPKKGKLKRFWRQHIDDFSTADLIYFNTLESHFNFFNSIIFSAPSIMRIHNVNASLLPLTSIDWNWKNWLKNIVYLLRKVVLLRMWHTRKAVYLKASLLMLPSTAILHGNTAMVQSHGFQRLAKYCLPFFSLSENHKPTIRQNDEIVFAITGSVDPQRKDYRTLYAAINMFKIKHPTKTVRMLFLGSPRRKPGFAVIAQFEQLQDKQFKLEYYPGYVPQDEVCRRMQEVQFLVAPIRLKAKHKIHVEYYGKTKVSGIENDAVNFRKPVILPAQYRLPEPLNPIGFGYHDTQSLYQHLVELGINRKYIEAENAFDHMPCYRRENIANDFYHLYQDILCSPPLGRDDCAN